MRLAEIFCGLRVVALLATALAVSSAEAAGPPDTSELVKVDLIAEPAAIHPGEPLWVGVRMVMKEHWHTYWRNPGDSGLATQIDWTLPPGFVAGDIQWPAPKLIEVGPLANFGYDGEAVLLTRITPPEDLAGAAVRLAAQVSFLVCEEICIPGEASVSLPIPVAAPGSLPVPGRRATFDAARARLPQPSPWPAGFAVDGDVLTLSVSAAGLKAGSVRSATFFPFDDMLLDHAARQKLTLSEHDLRLTLQRSRLAKSPPAAVDGVLVLVEDLKGTTARQAFTLNAAPTTLIPVEGASVGEGVSLWQAILLALVGGLVLNLMPCVFPVLSIKILHLTQHSGEPPQRVRLHGLAYTVGVMASFAVLAGLLFAIRAAGAEIGWGFQLQSPLFVTTLAFVLFAMGLSLSGVFSIGTSLMGVGGALSRHGGVSGSLMAGILATIVATPCTAPFMGAAVGFAVVQPAAIGLTVFLALGFGLALPFLVLSLVPGAQRLLPRPGAWMEMLKQLLAFPLYATVAWLIWVLSQQVGPTALFAALGGLVLVGFAAWALEAGRHIARAWPRRLAQGAALAAMVVVAGLLTLVNGADGARQAAAASESVAPGDAEPFSQTRLDALLAEGRPVFVNMTAAWCITCIVNDRTALSTSAVRTAFDARGVAYLKGDWTNRNPEITRVLEKFGRSGVPLYVIYGNGETAVLPQILTASIVLQQLDRLAPVHAQGKSSS